MLGQRDMLMLFSNSLFAVKAGQQITMQTCLEIEFARKSIIALAKTSLGFKTTGGDMIISDTFGKFCSCCC